MKTLLLICTVAGLCLISEIQANDYKDGQVLTVTANAGLRLRMAPDMHAKTISILEQGQEVVVENTFGYPEKHKGRIEWMDGFWIKVSAGGVSGYVFDGFLSSFPPPTHEAQLCIDCDNIVLSVDRYLFDNFQPVSMHDGPDHNEEITQFVTCLEDSICTTKTSGDGWFEFEAEFQGKRISEVIGLMRSLIVGKDMLEAFNRSMVFHEDRYGDVEKVQVLFYSSPVTIEKTANGTRLDTVILGMTDGC
jgi:hypothetical protein